MCFRADNFVVKNHFLCSSLGKDISPIPSFLQPIVFFCVGLRPCRLFSVQCVMSLGAILVQLTFGWYY